MVWKMDLKEEVKLLFMSNLKKVHEIDESWNKFLSEKDGKVK